MHDIATIGYEGAEVGELVRALKTAGIARLVDVRAVANSRKRGFSKHVLARHLAEAGIAYTHLKPLGTPKAGRDAARAGDIPGMHRIYAGQLETPEAQLALAELREIAANEPVCLLCYEADHKGCHRQVVADLLRARQHHLHPMPLAVS